MDITNQGAATLESVEQADADADVLQLPIRTSSHCGHDFDPSRKIHPGPPSVGMPCIRDACSPPAGVAPAPLVPDVAPAVPVEGVPVVAESAVAPEPAAVPEPAIALEPDPHYGLVP